MSYFVHLLKSLRSLVSDTDPLAALAASASSIHAQAWGRKWPHSYQGTIRLSNLKPCPPTTLGSAVERFEPLDGLDDGLAQGRWGTGIEIAEADGASIGVRPFSAPSLGVNGRR